MSSAIDFVVTTAGARAAFSANAAGLKLDLVAVAFGGGKAQAPASDAEISLENELGRIDSRELAEGEIFSGAQGAGGNLTLTIVKPALAAGSAQTLVSELGLIAVDPDTGGEVLFAVWRDNSPLIAFSDLVAFRLNTVLTLAGLPSGSINITLDANFLEGRLVSLEQSAVRFDDDQGLTPAQQLQGRTNIGAADQSAIDTAINALADGAPGALDTLKEIAAALGNNKDAVASLIAQLALKADKARRITGSGLITGGGTLSANRVLEVKAASDAEASAMAIRNKALVPGNLGAIAAALIASNAFAPPGQYWEFTNSGTWTKPANVSPGAFLLAHVVGGGGGFSGAGPYGGGAGGGNGGGDLFVIPLSLLPDQSSVAVGAGGANGPGGHTTAGGSGGSSSLWEFTATGGGGGRYYYNAVNPSRPSDGASPKAYPGANGSPNSNPIWAPGGAGLGGDFGKAGKAGVVRLWLRG